MTLVKYYQAYREIGFSRWTSFRGAMWIWWEFKPPWRQFTTQELRYMPTVVDTQIPRGKAMDTAEETNKRIEALELENKILKSRLTTQQSLIDRLGGNGPTLHLHHEGVILRQRETLKNYTNTLWNRKQTIRTLRERVAGLERALTEARGEKRQARANRRAADVADVEVTQAGVAC